MSRYYHLKNGQCYILVEEQAVGREIANLQLAIKMSTEKVSTLQAQMATLDDATDEFNDLQDEMNDHQMLISDFNNRLDDLSNMPASQ